MTKHTITAPTFDAAWARVRDITSDAVGAGHHYALTFRKGEREIVVTVFDGQKATE